MKTYRLAKIVLMLLLVTPSIYAVNDFWLGKRYSIGVNFEIKHEAFVDPPKLKALSMPSYPIEFLEAGVKGRAKVQFIVREDGMVIDLNVVSTDHEAFGVEARKAVAAWSFAPGRKSTDGKPVAVHMQCEFDFGLNEIGKD